MGLEPITFKCPKCGSDKLEEVMGGVTVCSEITNLIVENGSANCTYEVNSTEDGEVERYQCVHCGEPIGDVSDLDDLAKVLEKMNA